MALYDGREEPKLLRAEFEFRTHGMSDADLDDQISAGARQLGVPGPFDTPEQAEGHIAAQSVLGKLGASY
jgi:hypothetical protein